MKLYNTWLAEMNGSKFINSQRAVYFVVSNVSADGQVIVFARESPSTVMTMFESQPYTGMASVGLILC